MAETLPIWHQHIVQSINFVNIARCHAPPKTRLNVKINTNLQSILTAQTPLKRMSCVSIGVAH